MTKQIRISEKVHDKLKIHVAKKKKSIIEFADTAIVNQIRAEKLEEKILSTNNKK